MPFVFSRTSRYLLLHIHLNTCNSFVSSIIIVINARSFSQYAFIYSLLIYLTYWDSVSIQTKPDTWANIFLTLNSYIENSKKKNSELIVNLHSFHQRKVKHSVQIFLIEFSPLFLCSTLFLSSSSSLCGILFNWATIVWWINGVYNENSKMILSQSGISEIVVIANDSLQIHSICLPLSHSLSPSVCA